MHERPLPGDGGPTPRARVQSRAVRAHGIDAHDHRDRAEAALADHARGHVTVPSPAQAVQHVWQPGNALPRQPTQGIQQRSGADTCASRPSSNTATVRDGCGFVNVVRHDDRLVGIEEFEHRLSHVGSQFRVERGERLVEQEHRRVLPRGAGRARPDTR